MKHKPHDHFAKQYLAYLLDSTFGQATKGYELAHGLQVDVMFTPTTTAARLQPLGLLGQLVVLPALLEPFWNQPSKRDIRDCQMKLWLVYKPIYNQARSDKTRVNEDQLPRLWILATSASTALLSSFGAQSDETCYTEGVFLLPEAQRTGIVAINQLPATSETLWLRILGKGATRQQAIEELRALPAEHPLRDTVLKLIYDYLKQIESQNQSTKEEKELLMDLSPAYYKWEQETLQKGRLEGQQEGRQEERGEFLRSLLTLRFGKLDQTLSDLLKPLLQLSPEESARLLLQSSREELLVKFGKPPHSRRRLVKKK